MGNIGTKPKGQSSQSPEALGAAKNRVLDCLSASKVRVLAYLGGTKYSDLYAAGMTLAQAAEAVYTDPRGVKAHTPSEADADRFSSEDALLPHLETLAAAGKLTLIILTSVDSGWTRVLARLTELARKGAVGGSAADDALIAGIVTLAANYANPRVAIWAVREGGYEWPTDVHRSNTPACIKFADAIDAAGYPLSRVDADWAEARVDEVAGAWNLDEGVQVAPRTIVTRCRVTSTSLNYIYRIGRFAGWVDNKMDE